MSRNVRYFGIIFIILFLLTVLVYYVFPPPMGPSNFDWPFFYQTVLTTVLISLGSWILSKVYPKKWQSAGRSRVLQLWLPLLLSSAPFATCMIAFAVVLSQVFKIELNTLLLTSGIISVVVGLALQQTLSNYAAGLALRSSSSFKERELIVLPDDTICEVRQVGPALTELYNVEQHSSIFVPNATMLGSTIVNITKPTVDLRVSIQVGVSYNHQKELRDICRELEEIAARNRFVLLDDHKKKADFFQLAHKLLRTLDQSESGKSLEDLRKVGLEDAISGLKICGCIAEAVKNDVQLVKSTHDTSVLSGQPDDTAQSENHIYTLTMEGKKYLEGNNYKKAAEKAKQEDVIDKGLACIHSQIQELKKMLPNANISEIGKNIKDVHDAMQEWEEIRDPWIEEDDQEEYEKTAKHFTVKDEGRESLNGQMKKMWDEITKRFPNHQTSEGEDSSKGKQTKQDSEQNMKSNKQLERQLHTLAEWLTSHYKMPVPSWKNPEVVFVGFADSSINLQLNFYIDDIRLNHFRRKAKAMTEVAEEISMRFAQGIKVEGEEKLKQIEIPFPQTDIHFRDNLKTDIYFRDNLTFKKDKDKTEQGEGEAK
jgi:small-conductance mechanosensitive channel